MTLVLLHQEGVIAGDDLDGCSGEIGAHVDFDACRCAQGRESRFGLIAHQYLVGSVIGLFSAVSAVAGFHAFRADAHQRKGAPGRWRRL